MDKIFVQRDLRRRFGYSGLTVLVYYFILDIAVSVTLFFDSFLYLINHAFNPNGVQGDIFKRLADNGWGYILGCIIGGSILMFWKKPRFCLKDIWRGNKPMTGKAFSVLFCVFISGQALFVVLEPLLEWLLNLIGLSGRGALESVTGASDSVSMFLYVSLFAPVFEEILFRGLILRNLMPYGKKFAILSSAFLFGLFHGNLTQSLYAFAVGLVLGYAAAEYSLGWAVLLHFINNFILGDLFSWAMELYPAAHLEIILYALIFGCAVVSLILAAVKSRSIADYLTSKKIHPLCIRCFFTSPGVLVFTIYMALNMLLLLFI